MNRKSNLAPFVDLFSILAIGLLVLMSVTSGTEKPETKKPSYTVVMLYLKKPDKLEKAYPGVSREEFIRIEPYFVYRGKEAPKESLSITSTTSYGPDSITVMLLGKTKDLSVGFRVKEIKKKEILFMEFGANIVATSNKSQNNVANGKQSKSVTVGMWVDPFIEL